ncbi:MAG: N-acetylneuraminate synthase [Candidatus Marinimicrobia bacterium]|nr:N-acetylneuraminate synthase [Candidatus Neomarinimicrobiota bacterium]|tara:strand:+ start:1744 stop:2613 length:870 start_codon:yes stop_codon:yes gene_type:complete
MIYKSCKTIAEIGCNHKGDINIAKELILLAKNCGADVAKFQKRNSKELLPDKQYNAPHPNPINSYGKTYGEHREFLEFSKEEHRDLMDYCDSIDIEYSTSVWDVSSAKEITELNPSLIKVPSASNTHYDMLQILRDEYKGDVHVSFGMTTKDEQEKLVAFFEEKKQAKDRLIIYSCTSGYPVPFEDVCLLEILKIKDQFGDRVKDIAFSGHHLGISIDIAAYILGASWIERHFTKDRTWKGTDHSASLEPAGFSKLTRDLKATFKTLSYKKKEILDIEKPQRDKLKFFK